MAEGFMSPGPRGGDVNRPAGRLGKLSAMSRLFLLLAVAFISLHNTSSLAQSKITSEFVKLRTADGISLHGALWMRRGARSRDISAAADTPGRAAQAELLRDLSK